MKSEQFVVCVWGPSGSQIGILFFRSFFLTEYLGRGFPFKCFLNWRALGESMVLSSSYHVPSLLLLQVCWCKEFPNFWVWRRVLVESFWVAHAGKISVRLHFCSSLGQGYASLSDKMKDTKLMNLSVRELSTLNDWGRIFAIYSIGHCFIWTHLKSEKSGFVDGYLHKSK